MTLEVVGEEWNDGYIIEGCDRCHNAAELVDNWLAEHPAIIKAGQQENIDKAMELLMEAYQAVGQLDEDGG